MVNAPNWLARRRVGHGKEKHKGRIGEDRPIPIHFVTSSGWAEFRKGLAGAVNAMADLHGFSGQSGRHLLAVMARPLLSFSALMKQTRRGVMRSWQASLCRCSQRAHTNSPMSLRAGRLPCSMPR